MSLELRFYMPPSQELEADWLPAEVAGADLYNLVVPAERRPAEVYAEGEEILGNHPDNDFCVELPLRQGGTVFIQPLDVKALRAAALAARQMKEPPTLAVLDDEEEIGSIDLGELVDKLQGY